jgi:hypothetical protein
VARDWDGRAERLSDSAYDHPWAMVLKVLAVILVLGLLVGACNWIGSWGGEAARVTSPQNVREQNTAIVGDWQALQRAAENACDAKDAAKQNGDPTLVEDPALAYKATYRNIQQDYDRRMANLYEAQAVRNLPLPSNLKSYPRTAPTLRQMERQVC